MAFIKKKSDINAFGTAFHGDNVEAAYTARCRDGRTL